MVTALGVVGQGSASAVGSAFLPLVMLPGGTTHATMTPTPTAMPTNYPHQAVIIDGPWKEQPAGAGPDLTLDQETGALTLRTVFTDLVWLLQPDPHKGARANSVWDMQAHQGRLYLGYGDSVSNAGPVDIVSYDPSQGELVREMEDIPEEKVGGWYADADGRLLVAGQDAQESWTFGDFYLQDASGWQKRRTVPNGLHVYRVIRFGDRLYAQYNTQMSSYPTQFPYIPVSENDGVTWSFQTIDSREEFLVTRVDALAIAAPPDAGCLYAIVYLLRNDLSWFRWRVYRTCGAAWEQVLVNDPLGELKPVELVPFNGGMLVHGQVMRGGQALRRTYALRGGAQVEVASLRDRVVTAERSTLAHGTLYCLVEEAPGGNPNGTYRLLGTSDEESWEDWGLVPFPPGIYPLSLGFSHGRLYIGAGRIEDQAGAAPVQGLADSPGLYTAANATGPSGAEYVSPLFYLDKPLSSASLFFESSQPAQTRIGFQVRSGHSAAQVGAATYVGPDGTSATFYETNGQSLWSGHFGATMVQYRAVLASQDAARAPALRQVALQVRAASPSRFRITWEGGSTWIAGQPRMVRIEALSAGGAVIALHGAISLSAQDALTGQPVPIEPAHAQLVAGIALEPAALSHSGPTCLVVRLADVTSQSAVIEVAAGSAARLEIRSDLLPEKPQWSPVGTAGKSFTLTLTVLDDHGNIAPDYRGVVRCECWRQTRAQASLPSTYTFKAEDRGQHTFPQGATIPEAGEWNIACWDEQKPRIAGTTTVDLSPATD